MILEDDTETNPAVELDLMVLYFYAWFEFQHTHTVNLVTQL